jgi:hypothetical protein
MGTLPYFCVIKQSGIDRNKLWGDEIAQAWQTCPLVSGVRITG